MSILAKPSEILNPLVWEANNQLKSKLKTSIVHKLALCLNGLNLKPNNWVSAVNIIGSNTSNQYDESSDLDIDVEIDMEKLKEANPALKDKSVKEIKNMFNDYFNSYCNQNYVPESTTPINYHCSSSYSSPVSEGIYDVLKDKWIKDPVFIPMDFKADKAFKKEYEFVNKKLAPMLLKLEESFIENIKNGKSIKDTIKQAKRLHKVLKTLRNMRFIDKPEYTFKAYSLNWDYRNVLYKLLEKQGLTDVKEKLVISFPGMEKEINELWDRYHYKSSEFVPLIKKIEKSFEKF